MGCVIDNLYALFKSADFKYSILHCHADVTIHGVPKKTSHLVIFHVFAISPILTDFQNSFTGIHCTQLAIMYL